MKKIKVNKLNKFWQITIGVAVFLLAIFFISNSTKTPINFGKYLSGESLTELEKISEEYRLVSIKNLTEVKKKAFYPTSIKTDVLSMEASTGNLGVITKIEVPQTDETPAHDLLLSWQPEKSLTQNELKQLAQKIEEKIPEIVVAEPDQHITLMPQMKSFRSDVVERKITKPETKSEIEPESEKSTDRITKSYPVIAIIDSGIYHYHEDFDASRLHKTENSASTEWNFADNSSDTDDEIGHGTHIAGIIHENSTSRLMILSIFKPQTLESKLSYLISALEYAGQEADIVNLSLGIEEDSRLLHEAIRDLTQEGIVVVAGVGNNGKNEKYYPAAYDEVIAIATSSKTGDKSIISNYGPWVDYAAKGEDILSFKNKKEGYRYMSGTSQSAAFATAIIADFLYEQNIENLQDLIRKLDENSSEFTDPEFEGQMGRGILQSII